MRTSPRRRGIIPARAGFTNIVRVGKAWWGDHPRSRGVYGHTDASPPQGAGSSPLARGLRVRRLRDAGGCWIIPARAGFTAPSGCYTRYPGDHFRSRGVYHLLKCCCNEGLWIIPARAGFTPPTSSTGSPRRDHPRSRGVYAPRHTSRRHSLGSSPLARGLLAFVCLLCFK